MMEWALWLKIGTSQLVLAMVETGFMKRNLALADPVRSMQEISRDLTLRRKLAMEDGTRMTALDIQEELLLQASRFVARGLAKELVPEADEILAAWTDTLVMLRNKRRQLVGRIDWVTKLWLMRLHREKYDLEWSHPSMKVIDLQYANLDPEEGLYYTLLKAGMVHRVVADQDIERLMEEGPRDSRAHFRSQCLRRFSHHIARVDWDGFELASSGLRRWWRAAWVPLDDPLTPKPEWLDQDIASIDVEELLAIVSERNLDRRKPVEWSSQEYYGYHYGGN